jgi:hypothetical protein
MLKNHKNVYWTETRKKQDEENKKRLTDLQNKFKKNVSQEIEQKEIAVAKNISYQTIDVSISDLKNADKHFEESMVNNLYDRYFKSGGNLEQNIQKLDNDLSIAQAKNIEDYNNFFNERPVPKVYQEATAYNNLTPVFVDPLLFPHESFLSISKGRGFMSLDKASRKQFQKEWLIIRSFDEFVTIIPELFGIYEQPTRIPLALSLCFFFETTSMPRPLLTSHEEEDPEMYQYEQDLIDKKSKQRYKPKNDEKTGLDCFRWLVQNNYVPEFVNLHDFNSRNLENNRELRALFSEWQEKNNVLPKVQEHWF